MSSVNQVPDPEVPAKARTRRYSAAYKAKILDEYLYVTITMSADMSVDTTVDVSADISVTVTMSVPGTRTEGE